MSPRKGRSAEIRRRPAFNSLEDAHRSKWQEDDSMRQRSGATLFLMEQLIVIAVFALCASVSVAILVNSFRIASASEDRSNALRMAESAVECYKAAGGDAITAVRTLSGGLLEDGDSVYFDQSWQPCARQASSFVLSFIPERPSDISDSVALCKISVLGADGRELIAFPAAARRDMP